METNNVVQVNYSLKEKFLQVSPEQRIRRWQYFIRVFVPTWIFVVWSAGIFAIINILLPPKNIALSGIIFGFCISIWYIILFYKTLLVLVTKRCHDFWSDGKIARGLLHAGIVLGVINSVIALFGFAQVPDLILKTLAFIYTVVHGIWSILFVWILPFRRGNSGDNQYGKDPIHTKVSFLG
jgi:uncharacterized membrane protein YhaH (DUF805 family)